MVVRLLALLLFPALLIGCTSNPEIRVSGMDKVSAGPTADEYVLHLDLRNPNDNPIVLDRWIYQVTTNAGTWNNEWIASRTLPARSITFDSLPVVIRHEGTATAAITSWRVNGNLRYLLPGQMAETLFDLGVSRPDVDFSASGDATQIGVQAPAVNRR